MALRVLLADESSTIKKVMQLALQDFAVEVKAVHAGIDVLDVARSFQPDVVFADVLLQKKNGYEVCASLKADATLKDVPVILMWSSFMDLDESLAKNAGAEGRLEKPFDVETLRKLVLELVPKTRTQRLAHFLEFPTKATDQLQAEEASRNQPPPEPPKAPPYRAPEPVAPKVAPSVAQKPATPPPVAEAQPQAPAPPAAPAPAASKGWSMESFDDPANFADDFANDSANDLTNDFDDASEDEAFKPLELSSFDSDSSPNLNLDDDRTAANVSFGSGNDDESWTHQDLSRFKLDLPPVTVESDDGPDANIRIEMGEDQFTDPLIPQPSRHQVDMTPPPALERMDTLSHDRTGDRLSDFHSEYANSEEIEMPVELPDADLSLEEAELSLESSTLETGKLPPKLSADRLEEIIRAQSRDIIEAVVRKIVPDLATAIIREELERLLEDTAVRESRGGKGPNL